MSPPQPAHASSPFSPATQGVSGVDEFEINMLTGFVSLLVVGGGIFAFRSLGSAAAEESK